MINLFNVRFVFALAFMLFPFCLNAQKDEVSTLFGGDSDYRIGGYASLDTKFSQVDNGMGFLLGVKGGLIFNSIFSVGIGGYGLLPTAKTHFDCPVVGHENEKSTYWTGGYGAVILEYIHSSNRLLHFNANTLLGFGGASYSVRYQVYNEEDTNDVQHPSKFIFVVEPGVAAELNVSQFFRISLGVSYRYVPNFKFAYEGTSLAPTTTFNGFSANLTLKFGSF
ncbi:MAG: hypothetical protein FWH18_08320 [Marinilabiliaceae bacterium]|nr:hypothetical protein [Marinilabiliaceae bacterium]